MMIWELLDAKELQELETALDLIINQQKGFGLIILRIEKRRLKQLDTTYTIRPGCNPLDGDPRDLVDV